MANQYNNPAGGTQSTVGNQLLTQYYQKQALIEARKEQYFSQLADVVSMPKNMGKKIKRFHYIPLLDVQNLNDQGIDAAGATIATTTYTITYPQAVLTIANGSKVAAAAAINDNVGLTLVATAGADGSGGSGLATLTLVTTTPAVHAGKGGWVAGNPMGASTAKYLNSTKSDAVVALNLGVTVLQNAGNLYGSSKDIGTINGKLPALSETGGRVNRVGFKRKELEGTIEKFGFFDEYTQESLDFDTDAELDQHINREMINGANEMTEDALQIDLLMSAGVIKYAGAATKNSEIVAASVVTYGDLLRLSIDLDNNRCPKSTKIITGTRMVDTRVLPAARILFCGSEMLPTFKAMKDLHNNPAFISIEKYAAGGNTVTGEVGAIDQFRIVVVPEMMKWAGAGGDASGYATNYETNQRFDVFPLLVVGDESFTTIGFQTDGKTVKFKIMTKPPGEATADRNDPYGETGFMSIKWYYGFMVLRSERLAVVKTSATL